MAPLTRPSLRQLREEVYIAYANQLFPKKMPEEVIDFLVAKHPLEQIDQLINEAQDFVVRHARCLYSEAYATVPLNTHWWYVWEYSHEPLGVYFTMSGEERKRLDPISQKKADKESPNWEDTTDASKLGVPTHYVYVRQQRGHGGGQSIKLKPMNELAGTVEMYVHRLPTVMASSSDLVALEGFWYASIIKYVLVRLTGNVKELRLLANEIEAMAKESAERTQDEEMKQDWDVED